MYLETVDHFANSAAKKCDAVGTTPPIAFAGEDFVRGGVAILTAEEAAAALDQAACVTDKKPPRTA
jgi:hypothetical protein